ncbi:MAG: polyprenyl synthetase family protein [Actinobacteria bacterium]|nr:polyprenyl synthetase family protein [Actinomycetota bacterium]
MRAHLPFILSHPDDETLELRARVGRALEATLEELIADVTEEAPEAAPLAEALRETTLAGGKRLRPMFCVWGYRAGDGREEDLIIRVAAAIELLHTFAIVQDDLMDASRVRRNRPALHVRLGGGDPDDTGAAKALLVADLAMVAADRALSTSGFAPERLLAASAPYHRMRIDAIAGQYLDVAGISPALDQVEAALQVGALKSGGYTVEGPLLVGAALAGDDPSVQSALRAYGAAAGRAFQIRDDVLGVFGTPEITGKDEGADLRNRKPTVLLANAVRSAGEAEGRFLDARLGHSDLTLGELEQVRQIILTSGALEETLALIASLLQKAKRALDVLSIPAPARDGLRRMADLLALRAEGDLIGE